MAGNDTISLGFSREALAASPYARFFRPELAPLAAEVREALAVGGRAPELFASHRDAVGLLDDGDQPVETGYTLTPDGGARVFCRTPMPGVTPEMWAWWFAWHGSEAARYKLWHPQAHLDARWADGAGETGSYIGRTSRVVEYIGDVRAALAIRFVPPAEYGLSDAALAARGEVAICARAGRDGTGFEAGAMIHHLRPTPDGCEMRSRFWLFGDAMHFPKLSPGLGRVASRALSRLAGPKQRDAAALLVHCAQEMAHLAAFLPALHETFGGRP